MAFLVHGSTGRLTIARHVDPIFRIICNIEKGRGWLKWRWASMHMRRAAYMQIASHELLL